MDEQNGVQRAQNTKIVMISDTHGYHRNLNIPACDLLIHAGDYTANGTERETREFISWIKDQPAKRVLVIPGNHDTWAERYVSSCFHAFDEKCVVYGEGHYTLCGLTILAIPWQFSLEGQAWYRQPIWEDSTWRPIQDYRPDILVTHIPPYMMGDKVDRMRPTETEPYVGSQKLREAVSSSDTLLHVYGHIHEGRGVYMYPNARTWGYNVASIDRFHGKVNPPVVVTVRRSPDGSLALVPETET